jgi:hypothetical protein
LKDSDLLVDSSGTLKISSLKVGDLNYPSIVGESGQVLSTDGQGNISLISSVLSVNGKSEKNVNIQSVDIQMLSGENVESAINTAGLFQNASQTMVSPSIGGKTEVQSTLVYLDTKPVLASSVTVSPTIGSQNNVQNVLNYLNSKEPISVNNIFPDSSKNIFLDSSSIPLSVNIGGFSNVQDILVYLDSKI